MAYAVNGPLKVPPPNLIARIGADNKPSIKLFTKLGFGIVKTVAVWNEVEMRWGWDPVSEEVSTSKKWEFALPKDRIGVYDPPSSSQGVKMS